MSTDELHEVFPAGEQPALRLSNTAGEVFLRGTATAEIRVHARKHPCRAADQTVITAARLDDGTVEVKVERKEPLVSWLGRGDVCPVDFEIEVPHACRVSVSVVSANLEARGLHSGVQVSGVSGSLAFEDLRGDLSIATVSGAVDGERLNGTLHLTSVSGDVSLEESDLRSLKLSSVSGDARLDTPLAPDGSYRLSTVSGSVNWRLPAGTSCLVRSSSMSGRVSVSGPGAASVHGSGSRGSLRLGEGGPEIRVSTVSGDVRLHVDLPEMAAIPS